MTARLILALLGIGAMLPGLARAEEKKAEKLRVLLLGDSTVIGSVCRKVSPKADQLEDVVRKLLAAEADLPPTEVVNLGQDGDMIHRLLATRYEKLVAKEAPLDFIFIRYGLNDLRNLKDFKTEFPANYKKLISQLRADHSKAEMVLETVIPYLGEEKDKTINDQVRAISMEEKLPLLDQYSPYAAQLKHGPNMLSYRRILLQSVPKKYHALIPAASLHGDTVYVMDNLLDVHMANVPDWFKDRHPNLAGYQVIGTQIANYIVPKLREKAKTTK